MKDELVSQALEVMKHAYAPYSNYHVGACVEMNDGTRFVGANIENASYGATNCGERSAIFAAYSAGYRQKDIKAIAIVSDGATIASPCGICRQVLSELMNPDTPIYLSNGVAEMETNMAELLPYSFGKKDL